MFSPKGNFWHGSKIKSWCWRGNGVEVLVKDTGNGIALNHLPHILDRFYRADPARARATGGAGLGLAIVKHLVELHGGHITVASEVGEGTTFAIRLPLRTETADCR